METDSLRKPTNARAALRGPAIIFDDDAGFIEWSHAGMRIQE